MNFIKAWQSLPDYGVSLFVVRFFGEKKDELLGIASNKIMRMSLSHGDHLKTWRFSTMKVGCAQQSQFQDNVKYYLEVLNSPSNILEHS